jgi:predicted lipase
LVVVFSIRPYFYLDWYEQNPKRYRSTTIGDFWDEAPQDEFLQEHHKGIDTNASAEKAGFRLSHNQSYVFEIKALRSYMPVIIDTDEFSLVNSYTFALLSKLAYATNDFNRDDGKTIDNQGAISTVISQLKRKERLAYSGDLQAKWLLEEIPYSRALSAQYYAEDDVGSEGYIIFNDELAIIGVRGTEPYFQSKKPPVDNTKLKIIKAASGMAAVIADKIESATDSPGMKDLIITDLDAAQIAPEEFGGTYVHQGFYQYTMALLSLMEKDLELHKTKKFYCCGHSLGGAGALLLSALIKDSYHPPVLRLYTYGMPRTGTRTFVTRYQDIQHYRHVNNHDLVAQIPMIWANNDITEGLDKWDVFSSGITFI